ncbi:hypothetical protein CYMTET_7072 [Cymbomonas tetramitiformis]|uniref:Uncharacterized protein n=1 Tax=Cymbomonas tetramitiformis TaxID=36881 RepID=A0AAE0GVZ1_9CHLO|nr:hypothetical protein CYMTET_7072 [Cymbomonas tetramitiformis]
MRAWRGSRDCTSTTAEAPGPSLAVDYLAQPPVDVELTPGERHSCVMRVQLVPGTPAGAARSRLLADQEAPLECSAVLSCVLQLPPYQRPDPPEASSAPSGRANSGLKLLFRHPLNWAPAASPLLALSVAAMSPCTPSGNVQFGTTRQQLDVMISVTNLFSSARKLTLLTEAEEARGGDAAAAQAAE